MAGAGRGSQAEDELCRCRSGMDRTWIVAIGGGEEGRVQGESHFEEKLLSKEVPRQQRRTFGTLLHPCQHAIGLAPLALVSTVLDMLSSKLPVELSQALRCSAATQHFDML